MSRLQRIAGGGRRTLELGLGERECNGERNGQ